MVIPIVFHVAVATHGLPLVAVLAVWGRNPPTPHRRLAVFSLFLVISDLLELVATSAGGTNLWLAYFSVPLEVGFAFWLLSAYQTSERAARFYQRAVPAVLLVSVIALLVVDRSAHFALWIASSLALIALIATMYTLVSRSLSSRSMLTQEDWFWICVGLALFWTCFAPIPAFAQAFVVDQTQFVWTALFARAYTTICAFLLISWGVGCQRRQARSPGLS